MILNMLLDCSENETMELREVKSLCGKLIDIRCLVRDFKFHLGSLILDSSLNGMDLGAQVSISDWTRRDLDWWHIALPVGNGG